MLPLGKSLLVEFVPWFVGCLLVVSSLIFEMRLLNFNVLYTNLILLQLVLVDVSVANVRSEASKQLSVTLTRPSRLAMLAA